MTVAKIQLISLWFQGRAAMGPLDGLGPVPVELTSCDLYQLLLSCCSSFHLRLTPQTLEGGTTLLPGA